MSHRGGLPDTGSGRRCIGFRFSPIVSLYRLVVDSCRTVREPAHAYSLSMDATARLDSSFGAMLIGNLFNPQITQISTDYFVLNLRKSAQSVDKESPVLQTAPNHSGLLLYCHTAQSELLNFPLTPALSQREAVEKVLFRKVFTNDINGLHVIKTGKMDFCDTLRGRGSEMCRLCRVAV